MMSNLERTAIGCASELQDIADEIKELSGLLAVLTITSQEAGESSTGSTINTEFVANTFSFLWDALIDKQKRLDKLASAAFRAVEQEREMRTL